MEGNIGSGGQQQMQKLLEGMGRLQEIILQQSQLMQEQSRLMQAMVRQNAEPVINNTLPERSYTPDTPPPVSVPAPSNRVGSAGGASTSTHMQNVFLGSDISVPNTNTNLTITGVDLRNLFESQIKSPAFGCVEKPKFKDQTSRPIIFLKKFESFCIAHRVTDADKLIVVKSCFEEPATNWLNLVEANWESFNDFKDDFLSYFWSSDIQYNEKKRVLQMQYRAEGKLSMSQYFLQQVSWLKSFTPVMSEIDILNEVMRQFPLHLQSSWSIYYDRTMGGALSFIEKQAAIHSAPKRPFYQKEREALNNRNNFIKPSLPPIRQISHISLPTDFSSIPPPVVNSEAPTTSMNSLSENFRRGT